MKLSQLPLKTPARILSLSSAEGHETLRERLLVLGFIPGQEVRVLHQAPISHDPLAVEVRGGLIALRVHEADQIEVELLGGAQ